MTGTPGSEHDSQWYGGQGYDRRADQGQGYRGQGHRGQGYRGQAGDQRGYEGQAYEAQAYEAQAYEGKAYGEHGYDGQRYGSQPYNGHGRDDQRYGSQAYDAGGYGDQGYNDERYDHQGYDTRAYNGGEGYGGQGYGGQGYDAGRYDAQARAGGYGYADQATRQYEYGSQPAWQNQGYSGQPARQYDGYAGPRLDRGQGYLEPGYGDEELAGQEYGDQGYGGEGYGDQDRRGFPRRRGEPGAPGQRKVHFRQLRRLSHRRSVRVVSAIMAVFLVWVMFSAGQATFKNTGQSQLANLAEWMRDHYLGPVVTFGEWLTYSPPKTGGKPGFSYAVPKGEQVTTAPSTKVKHKGFVPDIPPTVKTLAAGAPLPGEGQWRVVEKVNGQPAILVTFLRDGGQYTSYSNGIASIDQRLVKFSLRPGTEDPGSAPGNGGNWGVPNYIPPGQRAGLLATFNGGFKLDAAGGGFYLDGMYHGSLVNGAASIVYYKNGTVKIGEWGRDFTMNSSIVGVRQNLKLLVDHGQVAANVDQNVMTNWGATLGGSYWQWRSGIGITKDGRIVYVYGEELDAQDLAQLLKQAGAVEGMQLDINPAWMKFDYYQANGHPGDPAPVPLLPSQQPSPYSYYTPSTRDFTAVYAR